MSVGNLSNMVESFWSATQEYELLDRTCGCALRESALRTPDAIALIEAGSDGVSRRRWTYAELLNISEKIAKSLGAQFECGTHIAVWGGNRSEWIMVQFGLALARMVMVTINPAFRVSELAYVLRQSQCKGIFYQNLYRGSDLHETIADVLAKEGMDFDLCVGFDELKAYIDRADMNRLLPEVMPQDTAMIQYTSGTTGMPKGAMLTHFGVINNSRIMALLKGLDQNTINLAIPPLFHTGGCVGGVLASIQTGGQLLLPESFDADLILDLAEKEKVTYLFAVPTMLVAMLEAQHERPRNLSTLKTVFSGGSIVPIDIVKQVEALFGVCLIIGYGMTESSPAITHTRLADNAVDKSETIGLPIPQIDVKIIDPASGEIVSIGQSGELCTRGFHVMSGYYDMVDATAEAIDQDGWLHTGDLCSMDIRGYCRVTGRMKDMIIRGGENVYPREIEEILYTHPAIAEAAVIGLPDDYWGEEIAGVLTLKQGCFLDAESLRNFTSPNLARHKIPKHWFVLNELPMTTSGKVQKFSLVQKYISGELNDYRV